MKSMVKLISFIAVIAVVSIPVSYGADQHDQERETKLSGVESLSPELRELLAKEMQAIQKGMMSLVPAYASGNWNEIESIASKIERSYILKQSIGDQQVKELHSVLPDSFLKLDQQFHYYSGMLSHAAKNRKPELVGFYLSKLSESCVTCHSLHATHRFPGFVENKNDGKHLH